MPIRSPAPDLDGTLLNSRGQVSQRARIANEQAGEDGGRVAFAIQRRTREARSKVTRRLALPRSFVLLRGVMLITATLCAGSSVWAQQPTATFSGRITDQSTGQGIAAVAVVAQGNQTGTRVAITDVEGNYSLPLGANTNIRLRAYKTGFVFNPAFVGFSSIGGQPITGSRILDFTGVGFPLPVLIFAQAPILLTEDESLNALALDAVLHTRDPFSVINDNYFGDDKRTRIKLFLVDLDLFSGETLAIVAVQANDAQQRNYTFPVEDRRKVPDVPWMVQLTVLVPSDLIGPADLTLIVSARGQASNSVNLRIR